MTACTLSIGQRANGGRIHNVIVPTYPSHIITSNNPSFKIGNEMKRIVSDGFEVLLPPDIPSLILSFGLVEPCVRFREAFQFGCHVAASSLDSSPDIIDHMPSWRCENVILRKVPAVTTHRSLGPRSAVGLLAMIHDAKRVGLSNSIAPFTQPAAVSLLQTWATTHACGPQSPLGSPGQTESSWIFQQGSGRPTIAAFTIDIMIVLTIDVTIGNLDSSFPPQCHQNS